MRRFVSVVALVAMVGLVASCTRTKVARNFNGLPGPDGKKVAHLNTTNIAIDLLFKPLLYDATLDKTVSDMTVEAKAMSASEVRIVQSYSRRMWYVFLPFSLIIHPVVGNVAADAVLK